MNNNIQTYYIPNNPNINKGPIYTIYKNNINNLNLSSIISTKTISIPEREYNKLIEIINEYNNLLIEKNKHIRNLVNEENKTINKLTIINKQKEDLTKKLSKGDRV